MPYWCGHQRQDGTSVRHDTGSGPFPGEEIPRHGRRIVFQELRKTDGRAGTRQAPALRATRYALRRYAAAYPFILPVVLLYAIFVLRPTLQTFWLAFWP